MNKFDSEGHLFVYDERSWKSYYEKDYCIPEPPSVTEVQDGILLPFRKQKESPGAAAWFEGGVCDSNGQFVAGHYRDSNNPNRHFCCIKAYQIPEHVEERHETVIYCGVLFEHFGHLITDSFTRLWYLADHPDTTYKLVFVHAPITNRFQYHYNVLEAAGITKDRIEIITKPTKFDKIIVPQESLYMMSSYRPGVGKIYDYIQQRVSTGIYKKVYLSRSAIEAGKVTINEKYFEDFYERRGYKIVYPEQLPFKEQVSIMAGAEEVVCSHGTLVHLTAFCKPGTRVVILNRSAGTSNIYALLQGRDADYYIIDVYLNFLPALMSGGSAVYFLGPTIYWKQYLDSAGIAYDPEEVSTDLHIKPYVYDYVLKWGQSAATPGGFTVIRNNSLIDIVDGINHFLGNTQINRKLLPDRDDVIVLKKENVDLKNKITVLETVFQTALTTQMKTDPQALQQAAESTGLNNVAITDDSKANYSKDGCAHFETELKGTRQSIALNITVN